MHDELSNGFFKHVNIKHGNIFSLIDVDSDLSEFYYPDEMTNENQKNIYIGVISNEENLQNFNVFTMANVKTTF